MKVNLVLQVFPYFFFGISYHCITFLVTVAFKTALATVKWKECYKIYHNCHLHVLKFYALFDCRPYHIHLQLTKMQRGGKFHFIHINENDYVWYVCCFTMTLILSNTIFLSSYHALTLYKTQINGYLFLLDVFK